MTNRLLAELGDTLRDFAAKDDLDPKGADVITLERERVDHFRAEPRGSIRAGAANAVRDALIEFENGDLTALQAVRANLAAIGVQLHLNYADIGKTGRRMLTSISLVHRMGRDVRKRLGLQN